MNTPITPWSRWRILVTLIGTVAVVVAMVVGVAILVVVRSDVRPDPTSAPSSPGKSAEQRRDLIAAAAMRPTRPEEARPGTPPAAEQPGTFPVPTATTEGPAGVPSGFPHTAAGAVGQLAAIQVTAIRRMSIDTTADIHRAWVAPGGPTLAEWRLTGAVRSFLAGAGMGPVKDRGTLLTVVPVGALVKGTDGPDWVVACVLLDVTAVVVRDSRVAYGVCERMEWTSGRWRVSPGTQPAPAPCTWPGTPAAVEAGWLGWREQVR